MVVCAPLSLVSVHLFFAALVVSLARVLRLRRHHCQVGVRASRMVPREGRVETRRHRRSGHRKRRRQWRQRLSDIQWRSGRLRQRRRQGCSLWRRSGSGGCGWERRDFLVRFGSRRRHRCESTEDLSAAQLCSGVARPFCSCENRDLRGEPLSRFPYRARRRRRQGGNKRSALIKKIACTEQKPRSPWRMAMMIDCVNI